MANTGLGQIDKLSGYAGLFHDVAAKNEEGDSQQHGLTGGGGDKLGNRAQNHGHRPPCAQHQHGKNAGNAEAHCNRRAQKQKQGKDKEQNKSFH